jgi:hypothetical protein
VGVLVDGKGHPRSDLRRGDSSGNTGVHTSKYPRMTSAGTTVSILFVKDCANRLSRPREELYKVSWSCSKSVLPGPAGQANPRMTAAQAFGINSGKAISPFSIKSLNCNIIIVMAQGLQDVWANEHWAPSSV